METVKAFFVDVQGVRVRCWQAGESGSPVLLLHGGGIDSAMLSWRETILPLANGHRVFAADWPGYGESDFPPGAGKLAYYLSFLPRLMDALSLPDASLVGLSMGGGIALGFALENPARVQKLVLVDSYGLAGKAPAHLLSYLVIQFPWMSDATYAFLRRNPKWARLALGGIFHNPKLISDDLAEEVYRDILKPSAGRAFAVMQRDEISWKGLRTCYMDRLGGIAIPTLIVQGANDTLVPLKAARMAHERFPGSQLHVIPDCGHWPPREKPDEFLEVVRPFLAQ